MTNDNELEAEYPRYFAFGDNPVKLTYIDDVPILGEVIDYAAKTFKIDNTVVPRIFNSLEVREIDHNEFRNLCLSKGVKPI